MSYYDELHIGFRNGLLRPSEHPYHRLSRLRTSCHSAVASIRRLPKLWPLRHRTELQVGRIWFFAASRNQLAAIESVQRGMQESQLLVTPLAKTKEGIPFNTTVRVHWYWKPSALLAAFQKHLGTHFAHIPDKALLPVGIFEELQWLMRFKRPAAIVVANDHTPMSRAVIVAAQSRTIPVIYLPHAQVSAKFPALCFDLSLLTGQAMLDTYREAGPVRGKVVLIGTPKLDEVRRISAPQHFKTVGICFNSLDRIEEVIRLYETISSRLPLWKVLIRPHPSCRSMAESLPPSAIISDSHAEAAPQFLARADVIIANNSSIALEAAVMRRPVISFDLSAGGGPDDYYGFLRHGLVVEAKSLEQIVDFLREAQRNAPPQNMALEHFEACPFDASATERAIHEIRDFIASF